MEFLLVFLATLFLGGVLIFLLGFPAPVVKLPRLGPCVELSADESASEYGGGWVTLRVRSKRVKRLDSVLYAGAVPDYLNKDWISQAEGGGAVSCQIVSDLKWGAGGWVRC